MILLHCFLYLFLVIRSSSNCCNSEIGDANLMPGMFFPESNNTSSQPPTTYPVNVQNGTYNIPQQNGSYTVQQQNGSYTAPQNQQYPQVPYQNTNTTNTLGCDNTLEREKFRTCVSNALRSLAVILENCRKTLGQNAKECKINQECLESLIGKKEENNERYRDDEKQINDFMAKSSNNDSLSEFLEFLEKRLDRDKSRNEKEYDIDRNNYDKYQEDWDRNDNRSNPRYDRERRGSNNDRDFSGDTGDNYKNNRRKNHEKNNCKDPCDQLSSEPDRCFC